MRAQEIPRYVHEGVLDAGISGYDFRAKLDAALAAGFPVFVSEWGISKDEITGQLNTEAALDFIEYAKQKRISWANWSFSNKDECYSAIRPDVDKLSNWNDDDLSPSGKIIFNSFGMEGAVR